MAASSEPDPHDTDVWIIRHGETEWSRSGQHTSRTDLELTPKGEQDAIALAPALHTVHFDLALCSPRQRARRTAELAGISDVQVDDDLAEWDYGEYEGRTRLDIQADRPTWSIWADGCPGGESPEQVAERVDGVIERCRATGGRVVLFAHGHILRALAARWIAQPVPVGAHLELVTGRVSVLGNDRGTPTLELWNALPTTG